MPSWKKIIVSGSSAILNQVTSSGGFSGDGSGISNVTAASVTYANVSSKPTLISGSAQISTAISGAFTDASSSLASRLTTAESELGNTLISGSAQISTAISGAFTDASSSLASRLTTAESELGNTLISGSGQISAAISGAFTDTSSSLATRVTNLKSDSGSFSTRVSTAESRLDQSVKSDASPTFAGILSTGDVEIRGTLTAEELIVSSSVTNMTIAEKSGSTIFGDDSRDTHQFTGSLAISGGLVLNDGNAEFSGNVSGSVTSTGSFGHIMKGGVNWDTAVSASAAAAGFGEGGGGSAATGTVSGSAQLASAISGAFYDASSSLATRVTNLKTDSGSFSTRTTTLESASGSFSTRLTTAESELGNALISGSAQIATYVSGAFTDTSSSLATRVTNLKSDSGSFSTRVTNLKTDSGSFSSRVKTLEGSGTTQGVGQGNNVTFNKITTTSGPDVFGGNVTIAGNLTLAGSQSAAETLVIADQFGFFASGSEESPVDAGLLVQSGSSAMTGSALYHEITTDSTKNINGGRWAVAKDVKADDTAATPTSYVGTVTVGGDTAVPDGDDVEYGVGEMYITSDGEIYIYTGS